MVLVRLGTGISYVLIYSSLLVKLVFLISLNTGVYLPAMYQALLLFFAILVQVGCGRHFTQSNHHSNSRANLEKYRVMVYFCNYC